jgi:hypothetical protein
MPEERKKTERDAKNTNRYFSGERKKESEEFPCHHFYCAVK